MSNIFLWAFQTWHLLFSSFDQFNFAGTASLLWQFCFEPSSSSYLSVAHPDNIWTLWNKTLFRHAISSVIVLFWAFKLKLSLYHTSWQHLNTLKQNTLQARRLFCDSFVLSLRADEETVFCGLNNGCVQVIESKSCLSRCTTYGQQKGKNKYNCCHLWTLCTDATRTDEILFSLFHSSISMQPDWVKSSQIHFSQIHPNSFNLQRKMSPWPYHWPCPVSWSESELIQINFVFSDSFI